jgi:class 3 adenylate cyclase
MVEQAQVERSLPQGTVTFLCTDIEGPTRALERLGPAEYGRVLDTHRELLLRAINEAGGAEVDSQGDSLFAVFVSATAAIRAAVSAQRDLASHQWPSGAEVRVRMGLHTGEARSAERGYVGIAVHRARRVFEAGDGQMVVSSATHAIVAAEPPQGVRLQDLGEVRLPGFDEPERLYQIVAEGLPETSTD